MKKILIALSIYAASICLLAETNYQMAILESKDCEGTDIAIQNVMCSYGFDKDIFEPISYSDKLTALLK